jgi:Na+-driven multidrug efflux pump
MATVLSQLFTIAAYCYVAFIKKRSYIPFSWSIDSLRPRGHLIAPIFRIGFPAALGHLAMSLGAILYNRIIAEFGQASVAGYGAGSKVDMIVALPIIALASAVMSVVGMFAGAKRFDLVRKVIGYAFRTSVSIALLFSIAAFFASSYIIRIFTNDPDALQVGHVYLQYMVFAYPLMAVGITAGRILQGLGLGFPPFIITFMRVLLIGVPLSYIGVHYFHAPIDVIWMTMIGGSLIANILAIYWIRHYGWTVPAADNENAPSVVLSTAKTGPPLDTLPPP